MNVRPWHIVIGSTMVTLLLLIGQKAPSNVIGTVTFTGLITSALTRSIDECNS